MFPDRQTDERSEEQQAATTSIPPEEDAMRLNVEVLEERIAPGLNLGNNRCETFVGELRPAARRGKDLLP